MTAVAELLHLVRKRGAEVRFGGPTAIEVIQYRLLDNATLGLSFGGWKTPAFGAHFKPNLRPWRL